MSTRHRILNPLLLALALAALAAAPSAADRLPTGDLVLPYFELGLAPPGGNPYDQKVAVFAVGNCGNEPVEATITVWTNWGIPVLAVEREIPAKGIASANLRDWIVFGRLPDRQLTVAELAHLQAALSGLPSPQDGRYYATPVAENLAVGFVSAHLASYLDGESLWGDFFAVDPLMNQATGESLVRLVAGESREVCEHHLLRFLQGGGFDAGTRLVLWTGTGGTPSLSPEPTVAPVAFRCTIFDEAGNLLGVDELELLATQAVSVTARGWPVPFGWVDCIASQPTFACLHYVAEDRYGVALRSFCEREEYPGPPPWPRITLQKLVNGDDANLPPGPALPLGDAIEWTFVVTNPSQVALIDVEVADDHGLTVTCPDDILSPGETMTCTATGEAAPGVHRNVATATASTLAGWVVEDSDPAHYCCLVPGIDIEKLTEGEDADDPPGPIIVVGGGECLTGDCPPPPVEVTWTYVVTNTGEEPLTGVTVVDDQGVEVVCPTDSLEVGESMTCTATGIAQLGQYANVGTASGTAPDGRVVSDSDPSHYLGVAEPPPPGNEGCTPGYWKNHPGAWPPTGYATGQRVDSVFAGSSGYPDLAAATLMEALSFAGGPGVEGAAEILLRAGVAALLNAAHPGVAYPRTVAQVVTAVDAALLSANRDTMLVLAAALDADNNLGCPL